MYRDYAPKGVKFYLVYKTLAHPESGGYINPLTLEERLMHIQEAKRTFKGVTLPWLCDNMSNDLKNALGGLNNPEFVFDPDGKIVRLRDWSAPAQLRADLEQLVGPVANPTRVEDLNLRFERAAPSAPRGVVHRISLPGRMQPVTVTPQDDGENPYYVKLRAEADDKLLQDGTGKLYLGFHLDPIHRVRWNNLVAPVEYEITAHEGAAVLPATGKGPKVEAESDVDPRKFLVDVQGGDPNTPLELSVRYFACNDEQGWCKPVTQSYVIHLKRDRQAGVVRAREWGVGGGGRFGGARPGGLAGFGRQVRGGAGPEGFSVERLFRFDRNDDGKLSKEELPEFLRQRILSRADTNMDGVIDKQEAERLAE